jgi:hypothetical protein
MEESDMTEFDSYATLSKDISDGVTRDVPLSEDDLSLIWYLLVNAYAELHPEVDEAIYHDFLIEHVEREHVDDLLLRIQKLEGISQPFPLTEVSK